jgi:D-alanyl-D-alanine dipeptidase
MRIDEALAESKPLAVKFGAVVLNIEYRPPSYTIEQMMEAQGDKENPERLIEMLQDLIVGWDLTRIEKVPYDPETTAGPHEREVPVDVTNADDVRKYVKMNIIMGIIKAIREDNEVKGE